jgi:WS/DGAT/MGAT family acyltransferase
MTAARLSGLDTAFLCLEGNGMPMHMGALAVFAPPQPMSTEGLAAVLVQRSERIARLRRRVRAEWYRPDWAGWVDEPGFDARDHVHTHFLHRAAELTHHVARLMARPLNPARPLWEAHVIGGLTGDRVGVLVKLHHALTDGTGAVMLAAELLDGGHRAGDAKQASRETFPGGLWSTARQALRVITSPSRLARHAAETATISASVLRKSRPAAMAMSLTASPVDERRLATANLHCDVLSRIRKLHGGTANDAVLGVLTGAWRRCLLEHKAPVDPDAVRALIPVSMRRRRNDRTAGNQLSGYLCELPVGEPDPALQLRTIRARMDANKTAGPARGAGAFPLLAERVPPAVHRAVGPVLRRSATLLFDTVITHVPLPDIPLRLNGADLHEVYPIVPLAHGQQLAVGVSTYRNNVHIGLHGAGNGLPDLQQLAAAIPYAASALEGPPPTEPRRCEVPGHAPRSAAAAAPR